MGPPPRAQAILLLTVGFGRADPPGLKPLAIGEWNELSRWLGAEGVTPESLLGDEADALLSRWAEREAPSARSRAVTRRSSDGAWRSASCWSGGAGAGCGA